ncbi:PadR family transcriptional regulator [Streptomyces caniscabiei]|uniref:PadR family transcriptional regulator n=1 Tax=Streptomyces caniscabiei TaxID=2746961 RepID=UPI0029BD6749|nr:PadR family transcriptional regulator [Streptomyces caniscabiei]MDX2775813.1 PadR family transcriptional regulator [Streptomyces caniscabiei]
MIIRLLILGILKRRGSAHGYRMYRDLVEWRVETWTVIRPGSIYHALTQLEKQGFIVEVSQATDQKLGPSKTEYKLTINGEKEFIRLLELALKDINLIELSVAIAFMEYLPRQKVVTLLKQRQEAQKQIPSFLHMLPTEETPKTPAKHPELIRIWADSYTSAAASTEKLIQAIQSGNYIFKNEEKEK